MEEGNSENWEKNRVSQEENNSQPTQSEFFGCMASILNTVQSNRQNQAKCLLRRGELSVHRRLKT